MTGAVAPGKGIGVSQVFETLLDDAIGEISRREPAYFSRFELPLPDLDERAERYRRHPLFARYEHTRITECLAVGKAYIAARGVKFSNDISGPDPITALLLDSAMDAFAVEEGRLPIGPDPQDDGIFAQDFAASYEARVTAGGIRYFTGRRGARALLLVTAVGVPIAAWSKLLMDRSHGFRIIVAETRHSDLFAGGLRGDTDPASDAADIAAVLESEGGTPVDVLAWSNGARVAIDLAATHPALVRSLVLLGPALSGVEGMTPMPSQFEEQLTKIFAAVGTNRAAGNFFSKALTDSIRVRDWDKAGGAPGSRARTLLSLPAAEQAPMLIAPLANGDLLFDFMRRYFADLAYPIRERLSALTLPILVLSGDHDTIVSDAFTRAALSRLVPHFSHVTIKGAGHCVQDLQYRYFRWLVQGFLDGGRHMTPTARVEFMPPGTDAATLR